MPVTQEMLDEVALSAAEYEMIVDRLDREPNPLELGMFGSLWSEHCGYKHSKALLRRFPNTGPRVMVKPGEENAGVVDIGGGLAVTMKIESHNHPSAIEPYQGAATGVGGIVRDIFTMGARPIALLNSLRFGAPDQPQNRRLLQGVVAGIGGYGNCLGIPNVGGEVFFDDAYGENPLVNAMCVGLLSHGDLVSSTAKGLGNSIMLVGAETGRDGIHGASGLASRSFEETKELRSAVQVGNPFLEKCLIEACLEAAALDEVVAMQDLGAAGLTSAAIESAAKGGLGLKIDVAKVPRRESGMTPYEVMLSESQERMLVIVERGREARVRAIFDRWGLTSTIIGEITDDGRARIYDGNDLVCDASITDLAEAPEYTPPSAEPRWLAALQQADLSLLPALGLPMNDVLLRLLQSPNVASKRPVFRQYDHQVIDNTVIPPGADAALLRVKGTSKGLAFTTDGNGRFCHLDPYAGGAIAVMEAARNLACVGAEVVAVTDGLNFGNPEKPEVYYQMERCIDGMADACNALGVPVISGNVSLYNETRGEPIYPTPIVGALGLIEEIDQRCSPGFKGDGDLVYVIGGVQGGPANLAGSEYLAAVHERVEGRPSIDLALEMRAQRLCLDAIRAGKLRSAHDCSLGGLAVAAAVCCSIGNIGLEGAALGTSSAPVDQAAILFGEAQSRIVVSTSPDDGPWLEAGARKADVPLERIGEVGGERLRLGGVDAPVAALAEAWNNGLTPVMQD